LDFELSPEQRAFQESVSRFAQRELADGALARAHAEDYPWDVAEQLASQGLLGIVMPEADGGQGGSLMDAVIAIQAVAAACPRSADVVQAGNFGPIRTFSEYATADQKARYLGRLLSGKMLISLCMSEPEAGSAVTDLQTTARIEGDEVVLNGAKVFSTNSTEAGVFLVYCRFGPGVGGIGSVLVERGTPGLSFGRASTFMSGERWNQIYFEDCRIPAANVLLGAGGFKKQISGFNVERIGNASRALAAGRHAFDIARAHVLQRRQFGRPIAEFQGLQWRFAEAAVKLDSSQLLLYRAALSADRGLPSAYDTSVAKFACNQAGYEAADLAIQAMGAAGYSQESLVEYCYRRCRGWMIAGGSTEILKTKISEEVFGRKFDQRATA